MDRCSIERALERTRARIYAKVDTRASVARQDLERSWGKGGFTRGEGERAGVAYEKSVRALFARVTAISCG